TTRRSQQGGRWWFAMVTFVNRILQGVGRAATFAAWLGTRVFASVHDAGAPVAAFPTAQRPHDQPGLSSSRSQCHCSWPRMPQFSG
ncbi:hypothetical protein BCR44DRAFT_36450, partial [Catenaria anguillulae PL171]